MDRNDLFALVPHYAAMLVLVLLVLAAVRSVITLDLVGEFIVIALIVFTYRPAVKRLGVAPEPWLDDRGPGTPADDEWQDPEGAGEQAPAGTEGEERD